MTTGRYGTQHASARQSVKLHGAAVLFTRTTRTPNPSTGLTTANVSSVAGYALQIKPDLERYAALSLSLSTARTLLFAPTTYGQSPQVGDIVGWNGINYTVKDVDQTAPDGVVILAKVTITT